VFQQDGTLALQQDGTLAHREHNTVAFLNREMRHRLSACVRVNGTWYTFRARILTILSRFVITTDNSAK